MIRKKFVILFSMVMSSSVFSQNVSLLSVTNYPLYGMPWSTEVPPHSYVIGGMYPTYGDPRYTGYPHTGMPWSAQMPTWYGMLPMDANMQTTIVPMGPSMQKMYPAYGMPWSGMNMPSMYSVSGMYPMQGYVIQTYPSYGMPWR